ncbi:hypothetical protein MTER_24570 [Mycolicibacter terrae]|uniref:Uncharacterized protein n=1 Tax=Mycolicibacter terrae TaxID=1788 RepID=A0AAD1HYN4_9MYCO|nr:hypothetical protein [Mycolicibacter terrae]ORW92432.1 hypothetical protein AWC28_00840 [Mycolicibacter terrae]BBX23046.1 hypothetical protein MTER_24570 [Mycolicibacter terrae]SNV68603.1 Uncharacterised protein [Mycolicibacter terrae]
MARAYRISPAVAQLRGRVNALQRYRPADDLELLTTRQSLSYERLAQQAAQVVADWPAPTTEQLNRVVAILNAGSRNTAAAS